MDPDVRPASEPDQASVAPSAGQTGRHRLPTCRPAPLRQVVPGRPAAVRRPGGHRDPPADHGLAPGRGSRPRGGSARAGQPVVAEHGAAAHGHGAGPGAPGGAGGSDRSARPAPAPAGPVRPRRQRAHRSPPARPAVLDDHPNPRRRGQHARLGHSACACDRADDPVSRSAGRDLRHPRARTRGPVAASRPRAAGCPQCARAGAVGVSAGHAVPVAVRRGDGGLCGAARLRPPGRPADSRRRGAGAGPERPAGRATDPHGLPQCHGVRGRSRRLRRRPVRQGARRPRTIRGPALSAHALPAPARHRRRVAVRLASTGPRTRGPGSDASRRDGCPYAALACPVRHRRVEPHARVRPRGRHPDAGLDRADRRRVAGRHLGAGGADACRSAGAPRPASRKGPDRRCCAGGRRRGSSGSAPAT